MLGLEHLLVSDSAGGFSKPNPIGWIGPNLESQGVCHVSSNIVHSPASSMDDYRAFFLGGVRMNFVSLLLSSNTAQINPQPSASIPMYPLSIPSNPTE